MRFVVYGAGAIGGVLGGRLLQHGHDVVLVARGPHLEAIRDRGLTLESPDERTTLDIACVAGPAEVSWRVDDVVLLAMKSQDTAAAVRELAVTAPPATAVVCVQNGVDNERAALRRYSSVYGVCVMCPTSHLAPGVVQAHSTPVTGLLDVGRYPAGVDAGAEEIAGAFSSATFSSEALADVMRWKYAKLLLNLGNAVEAVCGPAARQSPITERAREEGRACLQAAGVAFASEQEDADRRGRLLTVKPIRGERRGGGSSWQSLARGSGTIETAYLNGEIVLLGRVHGVPTPVNTLLTSLADGLARTGSPPGTMTVERFLDLLDH